MIGKNAGTKCDCEAQYACLQDVRLMRAIIFGCGDLMRWQEFRQSNMIFSFHPSACHVTHTTHFIYSISISPFCYICDALLELFFEFPFMELRRVLNNHHQQQQQAATERRCVCWTGINPLQLARKHWVSFCSNESACMVNPYYDLETRWKLKYFGGSHHDYDRCSASSIIIDAKWAEFAGWTA